jgi:hypothetical protein
MLARLTLCTILLFGAAPAVQANDAVPSISAYRAILNAQYAARQEPMPARPEEAQRIYENYLQSMGKPVRKPAIDADASIPDPSR